MSTSQVRSIDELGTVHLIGIGGAGMSVVAELLAAAGVRVQGSDARQTPTTLTLEVLGVRVWLGHDASHIAGADTVVISSAVRESNPELSEARRRGLPVLHRSQALAALMAGRRSVAVAGAHGKTTTSAMIACVLDANGLDPSYAIGSTLMTAQGAIPGGHLGSGDILVAEADESDGSFLNYRPATAVVTNVEPDHLDHYGTREAFEAAFAEFADRIEPGGLLVACADDPGAAALAATARSHGTRVVEYGLHPDTDVCIVETDLGSEQAVARFAIRGGASVPVRLRVSGLHNLRNAAAAFAVAVEMGVRPEQAATGLWEFRGTGRRFEDRGTAHGVRVVDDYAHHPTEVAALLAGAGPIAGTGRVLVLFQPHLYSRTRNFAREFAAALDAADLAVVTGIYAAREDPDPEVGPQTIVDLMGPGGVAIDDKQEAARYIADRAEPGDLVLTVGAGDVTELGEQILDRLASRDPGNP